MLFVSTIVSSFNPSALSAQHTSSVPMDRVEGETNVVTNAHSHHGKHTQWYIKLVAE